MDGLSRTNYTVRIHQRGQDRRVRRYLCPCVEGLRLRFLPAQPTGEELMNPYYRDRISDTQSFLVPLLTMMGASIQRKERDRLDALRRRLGERQAQTASGSSVNATHT